jgi:probable HAF family extracellular repeat protein
MKRPMMTAVALAAMTLAPGAWAQRYKVIELPVQRDVSNYYRVTAHAVNEEGRVAVGEYSWNDAAEICSPTYCKRMPKYPKHGSKHQTHAAAINDLGQVAGSTTQSNVSHAVVLQDGELTDLGTLKPGFNTYAAGINNHGEVVGYGAMSSGYQDFRAFHWKDGVMTMLPTFGGDFGVAHAINDAGQIVGGASASTGPARAYLYHQGVMTDLGTLPGGDYSEAFAVSSHGDVAGVSNRRLGGMTAFRYRNGTMEEIGLLPHGDVSWAYGINDAGDVVGFARTVVNGAYRNAGFLYDAAGLHDLNELVRASDRQLYEIEWANDVNNQGDIAGAAKRLSDNELVAVILKRID